MHTVARVGGHRRCSTRRGGVSHPVIRVWMALTLSLLGAPAHAAWEQYLSTAANGPPGNQISALAQGRRGEIAVGTDAGAAIFDGDRWTPLADTITTFVKALLQDRHGTWWLGKEGDGLWRSDGSGTRRLDSVPEVPFGNVTALYEDAAGDLWVGMNDRLVRHHAGAGAWEVVPLATLGLSDPKVHALFEDHLHQLWVASPEGVAVANAARTSWRSYTAQNSGLAPDSVFSICEDRDGGIWFGTYEGKVHRLDPSGSWRTFTASDGVPPVGQLGAIARDSSGGMWFASSIKYGSITAPGARLARYDGHTFRPVPGPRRATPFQNLDLLLVDDPGNLWVGSASQGALRYNGVGNEQYVSSDPASACTNQAFVDPEAHTLELGGTCISAILEDHAHDWWFASSDAGLARLRSNGEWSQFRVRSANLPYDDVSALVEDRSGNLWAGSFSNGVTRIPPSRAGFVTFGVSDGLVDPSVTSLLEDSAGAVWVGTLNGVSVRQGSGWLNLLHDGTPAVPGPVMVKQMVEDHAGTIWILDGQDPPYRLWSVDATHAQIRLHDRADGLPDDRVFDVVRVRDGSVWAVSSGGIAHRVGSSWEVVPTSTHRVVHATTMFEDRDGRLWVGGAGVSRREGDQWVFQSDVTTLQADPFKFLQDRSGRIWFASRTGVAYTNGVEWKEYDAAESLASFLLQLFAEDTQGRIWAGGSGGLTLLSPDLVAPQTVFRLPPPDITTARNLSFAYGAGYLESADLEFQVTTDGVLASDWSPTTSFTMSSLSDGEHTFAVRARDWARNVDPTPAQVTFTVDATPPQAVISSPRSRDAVQGSIAIEGLTDDPRYLSHRIEVRRVGTSNWATLVTDTLALSSSDTLLVWDTRPAADPSRYPDGDYELRLSVQDSLGLVGLALVSVIVDNEAPFANVTSPVEIRAAVGGDVFTTDREVHVYIPPLALDNTVKVSIDPADPATMPASLPDGGVRVGEGWAVAWPGATLTQPGVLEMRAPVGETRALAIYKEESGSGWTRLGGAATAPGAPLSVPLTGPARFALFAGGTPAGGAGLSGLSLSPRAFSPQGSFGSRDVAIGFTLGRPGGVSVRVFNRAGRLQRVVTDGLGMPSGAGVVHWDGRDRDGRVVPEGLYLVTVEALGSRSTQTLAVLK